MSHDPITLLFFYFCCIVFPTLSYFKYYKVQMRLILFFLFLIVSIYNMIYIFSQPFVVFLLNCLYIFILFILISDSYKLSDYVQNEIKLFKIRQNQYIKDIIDYYNKINCEDEDEQAIDFDIDYLEVLDYEI